MKTDVLILGGGLTALTAAYEITRESNLQVTLLQCGGGASPYIHGFCLPIGQNDSARLLYQDTLTSGCGQSDPVLAHILSENSIQLPDWFRELGLELDQEEGQPRLLKALGSSACRIAGIQNATGPAVMARLRRLLQKDCQYTELSNQRGTQLLMQNGRVIGARCFDLDNQEFYNFYAGCVILATGGFCRIFPQSTNAPEMGGDGIAMAYAAGAKLRDLEFIQFEPCVGTAPAQVAGKGIITTMFYEGAVLRNKDGERFMCKYGAAGECVPKDVLSKCIAKERLPVYFDATAVPERLWQTVYKPYLQRYLSCGIDLRTTPVPIAPAAHTSCGGVVIDAACRTGVPGLLACGEVTGGLHGANRLGGNAGLETMVFGRIAGKTAVQEAIELTLPDDEKRAPDIPTSTESLRQGLQRAVAEGLGVVRREKNMQTALEQVERLLLELGAWEDSFQKLRLHHDLLTAKLTLESALARKNSLGCHEVE